MSSSDNEGSPAQAGQVESSLAPAEAVPAPAGSEEDDFGDLFGSSSADERDPASAGTSKARLRKRDAHNAGIGSDGDEADWPGDGSPSQKTRTGDRPNVEDGDDDEEDQQYLYIGADLPRSQYPKPGDKEFYLMKVPQFLSIEPKPFSPAAIAASIADHVETDGGSTTTPFESALSAIRWRYSPSKPTELQSNSRIIRWSDGSLTLQFASDPCTQYRIGAHALAPPQRHPRKPTPVSKKTAPSSSLNTSMTSAAGSGYDAGADSFTYLCAPSLDVGVVRIVQKVTASLTVAPPKSTSTAAFERLRQSIRDANTRAGVGRADVHTDPEVERKKIEAAEKEKERQKRRMEAMEITGGGSSSRRRSGRKSMSTGGRRGSSGRRQSHGLSDQDNDSEGYDEDDQPDTSRRRRSQGGANHSERRQEDYDDDDGFVANSDDEIETMEVDSDSEIDIADAKPDGRRSRRHRVVDDDE